MAAYRATVHQSTGYSPNYLMLAKEVRSPVDLVFGTPSDRPPASYDDYSTAMEERMKLENVSTADALQLEAGRRRAVPMRFNTSVVASLKSLSLSVAVLEGIYCLYVTLRCDLLL